MEDRGASLKGMSYSEGKFKPQQPGWRRGTVQCPTLPASTASAGQNPVRGPGQETSPALLRARRCVQGWHRVPVSLINVSELVLLLSACVLWRSNPRWCKGPGCTACPRGSPLCLNFASILPAPFGKPSSCRRWGLLSWKHASVATGRCSPVSARAPSGSGLSRWLLSPVPLPEQPLGLCLHSGAGKFLFPRLGLAQDFPNRRDFHLFSPSSAEGYECYSRCLARDAPAQA